MYGPQVRPSRLLHLLRDWPCYAEPFVGMGGIFLRRTHKPKCEALNDINSNIINLFRVTKKHPDELTRQFDWVLSSRKEFARLTRVNPDTLTDIQRVARFTYLQIPSFGGQPAHNATPGNMGVNIPNRAKLTTARITKLITSAHTRLQGVHIECLHWDVFIKRYDRPFTLFYIDPPYWGHENDYGKGLFRRDDFAQMAKQLKSIKGTFILSINDIPDIRTLFKNFTIESVTTRYTVNPKAPRRTNELLISNHAV